MPIRVLLIDDVVEVRRLVRTALRFRGSFEVVGEAADGAEAVKLAEELQPDVVMLDLGLPDLAGREVLTRIRKNSASSKVVVFSGAESEEREWLDHHVEGYVLKDEDLDLLVDLLESVGRRQDAEATIELPHAVTSIAQARRFIEENLRAWGLEQLLDDALLVTSELATNAVTHADSGCRLRLALTPSTLRIDVVDTGAGTPEPQPRSTTREHGRGLQIVSALTAAWGLEVVPGEGKLVWAELSRPALTGAGAGAGV